MDSAPDSLLPAVTGPSGRTAAASRTVMPLDYCPNSDALICHAFVKTNRMQGLFPAFPRRIRLLQDRDRSGRTADRVQRDGGKSPIARREAERLNRKRACLVADEEILAVGVAGDETWLRGCTERRVAQQCQCTSTLSRTAAAD